jgi:ribonuclease H-related protein
MASKKYYAVKVGQTPGVYKTWDECSKQVKGYPGALFKSFPTESEAREYACGIGSVTSTTSAPRSSGRLFDIYVDGSYSDGKYSWAFAVYEEGKVIHQASGVGEDSEAAVIRNVAGEIAAAEEAIKWADKEDACSITIHHDYIGISEWATGKWKANNKFTQAYARFVSSHLDWVKFNKVTGHSGNEGNELVDRLAGEALGRK